MKSRFSKALAAAGVMLIALTGCTDAKINVDIKSDETASLDMSFQIQRDQLDEALKNYAGGAITSDAFVEQLKKTSAQSDDKTAKIEVKDDKKVIGLRETSTRKVSDVPKTGEQGITISQDDSNYLVNIPANTLVKSFIDELNVEPEKLFTSFDVAISFPGDVQNANYGGKISGNTVTWNLNDVMKSVKEDKPLKALGAVESSGPPLLLFIVIGLFVIAAAGIVAYRYLGVGKNSFGPKGKTPKPVSPSEDSSVGHWNNTHTQEKPVNNIPTPPAQTFASSPAPQQTQPMPPIPPQNVFPQRPQAAPQQPNIPFPSSRPLPPVTTPQQPSSPPEGQKRKPLPPLPPLPPRR
jgi:hypothetical protein